METLVEDVQEETVNFEAMVQGKQVSASEDHSSSAPATPLRDSNDSQLHSRVSTGGAKITPTGQMTLFHHGFNKLYEQVKSETKKLGSSAKKLSINPYPSQKEQDDFVKKTW